MELRILIADDEPEIVEGLALLIEGQNPGWHVTGKAHNGLEGFDLAIAQRPDIIITDIRMPQADGLDMIRDLNDYGIAAEFILISGYAEFQYAKRAMEYGVKYFLTKPIDEEELFADIVKISGELRRDAEIAECPDVVPYEEMLHLEEAMDAMDNERLHAVVGRIFRIFRSRREELGMENLRLLALNLVAYGTRKFPFARLRINNFLGTNVFTIRSVSKLNTVSQLESWVFNMLKGANEILLNDSLSAKHDVVREAQEYIRENFNRNISLNEIAEHFYINPYYFSQLFKKKTGITYQKYLTDLRMNRARKLLRETDMKVYEICAEVGYTDTNYFSRLFERSIGMKPSAYRADRELRSSHSP